MGGQTRSGDLWAKRSGCNKSYSTNNDDRHWRIAANYSIKNHFYRTRTDPQTLIIFFLSFPPLHLNGEWALGDLCGERTDSSLSRASVAECKTLQLESNQDWYFEAFHPLRPPTFIVCQPIQRLSSEIQWNYCVADYSQ